MLKIIGLLFLLALNGFILNHAMIQNKTIKIPSFIISLVFIILSLPMIESYNNLSIVFSLLLLTLTYIQIINFNESISPKKRILKSSFFLSLMTLINIDFFLFYFILFFALIYYSKISWRHFAILLIGLTYPWIIYYSLYFIDINLQFELFNWTIFTNSTYQFNENIVHLFVLLIFLILASKELYFKFYKKSEHAKKAFNILFIFSFLILLQVVLFQSLILIYLLILPLTIIVSNYLIYIKSKKIRTFLLGLLLISFIFKFL